ncbi:MAG: HypC/HybG/HupF family hydrogenase formation chaperone [Actinobacteria bacterium]|nr:MAG: HypC/HybG/HupF family hydrogenase formation chaperone [Actinomycetota bacterium]REK38681.1 MAG: HypC/HybG/HupF family hydrogenase formation chaperone [Actinomycetota bacterium]
MCVGTTGKIVEFLDESSGHAIAELDGARSEVSVAMIRAQGETVEIGDWVHIHLGIALEKTDESHAREAIEFQRSIESGVFPEIN